MNRIAIIILLMLPFAIAFGQNKAEFSGQLSAIANFSPDATYAGLLGGRYIPEFNYSIPTDSSETLDFEASANISGSVFFNADSSLSDGIISPYRLWARYTGKQFELRAGLQKIDFGSASILRPLQWFNQIDPRDPLQLTNGVYGLLGRYYFLNNANIWIWGLYGNKKTRGFDAVETNDKNPEFGGRIQYPVPKGELAFSYHHRTADASEFSPLTSYAKIPEDRFALDGKWDVKVGLWFEASYIRKHRDLSILTHQSLFNFGTDYTFGVGNGLTVIAEHLILSYDEKAFDFKNTANVTAATMTYPLGFYDNLSSVFYYNWETEGYTFFLNYAHQFPKITAYVFAFYNSESGQQGIQQNDFVNNFSGPGIQIMAVYNH